MPAGDRLTEYLQGLYQGKTTRDWYGSYKPGLEIASPQAVDSAIDRLAAETDDYNRADDAVSRFIRAASRGLDRFEAPAVPAGHFIDVLIRENRALEQLRKELQALFKDYSAGALPAAGGLASALRRLNDVPQDRHAHLQGGEDSFSGRRREDSRGTVRAYEIGSG